MPFPKEAKAKNEKEGYAERGTSPQTSESSRAWRAKLEELLGGWGEVESEVKEFLTSPGPELTIENRPRHDQIEIEFLNTRRPSPAR